MFEGESNLNTKGFFVSKISVSVTFYQVHVEEFS